ncbi:hypothetical protein HK096_003426 [Nowakowskiella sp. JEL0078]|nr:hypothetical protein HK096_003426 [Nowakowskiella sp. JEL0078]
MRISQTNDLESELLSLKQDYEKIKSEFQNYKLRAHAALQKSATGNVNDIRISELETVKESLEAELRERMLEWEKSLTKIKSLQGDLLALKDHSSALESHIVRLEARVLDVPKLREQIEQLQRNSLNLAEDHQKTVDQINAEHKIYIDQLKRQMQDQLVEIEELMKSKNDEHQSLQNISEV